MVYACYYPREGLVAGFPANNTMNLLYDRTTQTIAIPLFPAHHSPDTLTLHATGSVGLPVSNTLVSGLDCGAKIGSLSLLHRSVSGFEPPFGVALSIYFPTRLELVWPKLAAGRGGFCFSIWAGFLNLSGL